MNQVERLSDRFRECLNWSEDEPVTADALIGVLQLFRPDGEGLTGLFDELEQGVELARRLRLLYQATGETPRPGGGRDAYFIVRDPPPLDPELAREHAVTWLRQLADLARVVGADDWLQYLEPLPTIRVLEGIAPKQTKADLDTVPLYRLLKRDAAGWTERLPGNQDIAAMLRPAFYFAACDWALRDHLLWPLHDEASELDDPFAAYFELWRHNAKLRAMGPGQLDVYLPHTNEAPREHEGEG